MNAFNLNKVLPEELCKKEPINTKDSDIRSIEEAIATSNGAHAHLQHLAYVYQQRGYNFRARAVWLYLARERPNTFSYISALAYANIQCKLINEATDILCSLMATPRTDGLTRKWAKETITCLVTQAFDKVTTPPLDYHEKVEKFKEADVLTTYNEESNIKISDLEAIYAADPNNVMMVDWLALARYRNDDFAGCIELLEKLVAMQAPRDTDLYYLGCAHLGLLRVDEAVSHWRKMADQFPKSPLVNKVVKKLRTIRELTLDEDSPKKQFSHPAPQPINLPEIEMTSYEQGDGSGLAQVEQLLAEKPDDPSVIDWAAFANYTLGNHQRACELYMKFLEHSAKNVQAHYYVANCHFKLGSLDKALKHWQEVILLKPESKLGKKAQKRIEQAKNDS